MSLVHITAAPSLYRFGTAEGWRADQGVGRRVLSQQLGAYSSGICVSLCTVLPIMHGISSADGMRQARSTGCSRLWPHRAH
jgi:hypothetical protein